MEPPRHRGAPAGRGAPADRILGVVLAGGASRRMGRDKAALPVVEAGRPGPQRSWLERAVLLLARRFPEPWVVGRVLRPGDPAVPTLGEVPQSRADLRSGCGPLAGYETGLALAGGGAILTVPCDLPRLSVDVLDRLLEVRGTAAAVAFRHPDGRIEPAVTILEATAGPALRRFLDDGGRAAHEFFCSIETRWLEISPDLADRFLNVNTPEDLDRSSP